MIFYIITYARNILIFVPTENNMKVSFVRYYIYIYIL